MILTIILSALAIWRLSNMFSDTEQEGLFNSLDKIRSVFRIKYNQYNQPEAMPGSIGAGLLCPYCSSVWFGIIFAVLFLINQQVTFYVSLPFALSTVVIFTDRLHSALSK